MDISLGHEDDLVKQLPGLKKRLLKYHEFAAADLSTMFDQGVLKIL